MTKRRFFTFLAALTAAATITTGVTAMPAKATKGNCDPGAGQFNEQTVALANGAVVVDARYGWDGVSVFPDCNGPLLGAHVTNVTQTQTWYAVFPRPRRPKADPIVITMAPGFDQTYTANQLSHVGLDTIQDLQDFTLTQINPLA